MSEFTVYSSPEVATVFSSYPEEVREKMEALRGLVMEVAEATDGVDELVETLKWGEPSYLAKKGSTLRMDWKARRPNQYAMYFQCTSQLVPSFRFAFNDELSFEGNRAIVFKLDQELPAATVRKCIAAALTYHKIKHLPTLGL